ncbi:probable ATP-dependent RNA helicase DHX37 [Physella acuta]|uniref:probable ATP-dependent RNA helicase DHX37 n=1 Tax=Physella acuta TaxID=109671 RepID=UPI0027DD2033|nr:probable ATP-dependent RNA helicase DHX37 [Physella acuta]
MGKKRKLNKQTIEVNESDNDGKKICLEGIVTSGTSTEGDTNMLVVIPKKKNKEVPKPVKSVKKLSKKERKRLTDIVQRKEKKERRAELLESLAKHQATEEEMKRFTSITEVYTQNFKSNLAVDDTFEMKINSIKGSKRKKKLLKKLTEKEEPESTDTDEMSTDEEVEAIMEEEVAAHDKMEETEKKESADEPVKETNNLEKAKSEEEKSTQQAHTPAASKPVVYIPLNRLPEMQDARLKLPILAEEQVVMETISENPVVIICGETGSGKTTQVPQFLYEAGYAHDKGIIAVTEPRRVAAISMAKRVAAEMNLTDREVSYQIRFEGNVTPETKIKFLTDGVLLKEVQQDPLLGKYSVVIIDEAHERSVYTDILIGLLSIIVRQREKRGRPLKLIIMSATLRVEDFTSPTLFKSIKPPPLVKVDARQFPVTVHFNKKTADNYITEAYKKICKIHRTLPEGGILVFVTGQQEVHVLVKKLRRMFPYIAGQVNVEPVKKESRRERKMKEKLKEEEKNILTSLPKIDLSSYSVLPQDDEDAEKDTDVIQANDDDEEDGGHGTGEEDEEATRAKMGENQPDSTIPLYVLPLYSLLSSEKQAKVFDPPPEGCRLCIIATNVAETSLTIPNIRYVVDTGKTKVKYFDKVTGVSTFRVTWVSQASANQRAGRAGRMGPGHCYRLYSSAVFSDFPNFSPPEITRRPVDDLVLQMKSMRIDKVANFPFPTPPDAEQIKAAETLLMSLGALRNIGTGSLRFKDLKKAKSPVITDLGMTMASFPVAPRYSKMLTLARSYKVLPYAIALVAALSVDELFVDAIQATDVDENNEELQAKLSKLSLFRNNLVGNSLMLGDMMVLLRTVGACEAEGCSPTFCQQLGVRFKAMREIRKLRLQLTNAATVAFQDESLVVDPNLSPPNEDQILALRKVVLGGLADHVARRNPAPPPGTEKSETARLKGSFQCSQLEELVYVHPESVLFKNREVEFVVYQSMVETSRLYMRGLCCVEPHWFPEMAKSYCVLSKALEEPAPRYDPSSGKIMCHRSGSFGRCNWEFPPTEMEFPDCVECYRWFAKFLLDGEVFLSLSKFKTSLTTPSQIMVKSWAKLQPITERLLKALLNKSTCTKSQLAEVWKKQPKFLQSEYLEWVSEDKHADVMAEWPPLDPLS